jgi:predicted nucleic acid-binding protein
MKATLLDTGVIVALLDRDERHHEQCVEVVSDAPEAIINNVANGVFQTPVRLAEQASPVEKLLRKYRHVPMALADACLVDLADQMDTGQILTLDHDFEIYRWRSRRKFELLIELS